MTSLVLSIGTGDQRDPERTLFQPLQRSLDDGRWSHVTLLPSQVSLPLAEDFAARQQRSRPGLAIEVRALPSGAENDADLAYGHFDGVLADVLTASSPEKVTVDFTRGTKAMSAALVLAAARHGIHHLRYVSGARDSRGLVLAGSEQVSTIQAARVDHDRRFDLARKMFGQGNFEAAHSLLDGLRGNSEPLRQAARYYAAWDRLDYLSAAEILSGRRLPEPPSGWERVWPTPAAVAWTSTLARDAQAAGAVKDSPDAGALRRLIPDLIANGERRIAHGQFEDALVRAYRVLELIGQARLAEWGIDTAQVPEDHPAVQRLIRSIKRKKQVPLRSYNGKISAGRLQAARLLNNLENKLHESPLPRLPRASFQPERRLANQLLANDGNRKGWQKLLNPENRNLSVLLHGFRARAGQHDHLLRDAFSRLEGIARQGWGDAIAADLAVARTLPSPRL